MKRRAPANVLRGSRAISQRQELVNVERLVRENELTILYGVDGVRLIERVARLHVVHTIIPRDEVHRRTAIVGVRTQKPERQGRRRWRFDGCGSGRRWRWRRRVPGMRCEK